MRRSTRLHDAVLQLQYPQRGQDVFARTSFGVRGQRTRRGVRVGRPAHRAHFAVGRAVSPVEVSVFEFQPRQTDLSVDPMGADPVAKRHRCHRLRDGRPGTANFLFGKHFVLGVPSGNAHVVRCWQLFREEHKTVVRGNRDPGGIPVVGQPDSPEGGRLAYEQDDKFERDRGRGFTTGRSAVYVCNHIDGRVGWHLLRQSLRHDRNVFVDIPASV